MMKQKVNDEVNEQNEDYAVKDQCRHYWIIEVADGPRSMGTCKYCGTKKEFLNLMPSPSVSKKHHNQVGFPDLPDVEPEEESE